MSGAVAIEVTALMERLRKRGATAAALSFEILGSEVRVELEVTFPAPTFGRMSSFVIPAAREGMALEDNRLVTLAFQRLEDEVAPRKE